VRHYRFKDLSITSSKAPFNAHLVWEHSTYGIVMVDSTNQAVLLISTDKGDNWSVIDLSDNANSYKIQAGFLDNNDLWLVMCDNDGTADEYEVCFIELDDTNDCNPITVSTGANVNTVYAYDIFKIGSNFYVWNIEQRSVPFVGYILVVRDVDTNPFVEKYAATAGAGEGLKSTCQVGYASIIGTDALTLLAYNSASSGKWEIAGIWFISATPVVGSSTYIQDYRLDSTNRSQWGVTDDGVDDIYGIVMKVSDSKSYLATFPYTGSLTISTAEHDIVTQLSRNNSGSIPNELEKSFGVTDKKVYEFKPRRNSIILLQDLSAQLSGNIIAITDNFLFAINSGGGWDVYEYTDVVDEISAISYNDGIMGIEKKGSLIAHPDFHTNWSKGDSIKIYDQYNQLEFWGKIIDKNRNRRGLYIIKIDSFTNEILRKTYSTTYSADDTDTKQKDIIDNACDFCYRSSSIVGTTTTYDYVYNRAIIYLFWLARRLERQVPYIEPDGKIWTKAYDGLAKNAMIYPGKYNFKEMADGTQGTDIDWLDSVLSADDHEIISEISGHRKVLRTFQNSGAGDCVHVFASSSLNGWLEFHVNVTDANAINNIIITREGGSVARIWMIIDNDRFEYDAGAGMVDAGKAVVDDTWYHVYVEWYSDNTFDFWVDGTQYLNGVSTFSDFTASGPTRWDVDQDTVGAKYIYIDSPQSSLDDDPAYTKGDNEVAWDLNNHWQDVRFIDIPGIRETIQGFFDGNTGITRNTVRYKNNAFTIRPIEATRDPIEQLKGISPLNELRDPKIEASTEADQLGDNRYAMWSKDTIYLGLSIGGQGYFQPGKTVHVENTGQITVAESNLVVLLFTRDPKNDEYRSLILSDNIILPSEFTNIDNTTPQQTHTAIVQALENQANMNTGYSTEDADLTFIFGRAQIDSRFADMMLISHRDMSAQDNYAFGQLNDGKTYINAPTGKLIYFQINDITKMSMSAASLNMVTNKITGLGDPINDQDAATKKYAGHNIASDDLIFSNDTEKAQLNAAYVKIKEIIVYRSMKLRVYWEHKSSSFDNTNTRVYINGVATGAEHSNATTSYVAFTEDVEVNAEDLLQIYGHYTAGLSSCLVKFMRIKGIEYIINDP